MPTSVDGVLTATYDTDLATAILVVDGSLWPSPVDNLTITRDDGSSAPITVRGVDRLYSVGGYFVGSDHEVSTDTTVTYHATGFLGDVLVHETSVVLSTFGAAPGAWLKVPGRAELSVRTEIQEVGSVTSETVGGVYRIANGGGAVVQTVAQWSGLDADNFDLTVLADDMATVSRVRAALSAGRVLLVQCVGSLDFDSGWYFVGSVSWDLLGQVRHGGSGRRFVLSLARTGIPAGDGQGVPGVTWAETMERRATWADVVSEVSTWFDLLQGA